jgi:hypothetical protein
VIRACAIPLDAGTIQLIQIMIHFVLEDISMKKEVEKYSNVYSIVEELISLSNDPPDNRNIVVTTRLNPARVFELDLLAKALGQSRSSFANHLLEAAINDAWTGFSVSLKLPDPSTEEWAKQYLAWSDAREAKGGD